VVLDLGIGMVIVIHHQVVLPLGIEKVERQKDYIIK